jgi:DDE family transposase
MHCSRKTVCQGRRNCDDRENASDRVEFTSGPASGGLPRVERRSPRSRRSRVWRMRREKPMRRGSPVPLVDQCCAHVTPGAEEILDVDDTFCAAHGGQQLAFWNAHHNERGFAPMHVYHVASGTPVVTILRPARTPKGHGGAHRHQTPDEAHPQALANDPPHLARRQPLRPGRGACMG